MERRTMQEITSYIKNLESLVIGYSGGVDSTLLMDMATEILGKERVLGVTMDIGFQTREEVNRAKSLAQERGWSMKVVENPLENLDEEILKNPVNRCYTCKKTIFSFLKDVAEKEGYKKVCDGANTDDLGDIRPGMEATKELEIASPFLACGWGKEDIRQEAKKRGLANWDLASSACLASRVAYGQKLNRDLLGKIEEGEKWLASLGFNQVRVRVHGKNARIELGKEDLERGLEIEEKLREGLENLGFDQVEVDPKGYRQGSLNEEVSHGINT